MKNDVNEMFHDNMSHGTDSSPMGVESMSSTNPPPVTSMSIHKGWLNLLKQTAQQYQLDSQYYFDQLDTSRSQIDVREVRKIHHQMFQDSGDPLFSAHAAQRVNPLTFGCFSLTLWTAPTVLQLLKDASKYCVAIGSPIRLRFHETPQGDAELWIINHEPLNKESHITYVGVTLYISTILQIIHQTTEYSLPNVAVKVIKWPFPENEKLEFEKLMHCNISTGSPIRKICVQRQHLFHPLATSDPVLYPVTQTLLRQHTIELENSDIVLKVYKTLDDMPTLADLSGDKVAANMLISIRTLNRRLSEVGTCYRGVLEKYKLEKALQLLNQPSVNMTEIAFQLGFSDLSTFSRAFKRWTGTSPSHSSNRLNPVQEIL
ncbi:transcriptional regulator, AraC family protein [Photobacterium profundum 3TCK]|uniref:Transcriptional regulator, AraC family protein n=2 Tax=Photobacterium profundum TaxID=74109 RepID=Q1Z540_9GAMM|nr:transcriptional regulator, AraC family protein [Photobacterium profundum 3TCK]